MKKYLIIILFALPILLSGCLNYEDIKIIKINEVNYEELKGGVLKLAITARVDNPNFFDVKITDANMVLQIQDRVLGNVSQVEKVTLSGRSEKDYTIRVSIELKEMLTNALSTYRTLMNDPKSLNLSGTVHVKSFLYSKTLKVDRLTFQ